jgi:hypothetical protein
MSCFYFTGKVVVKEVYLHNSSGITINKLLYCKVVMITCDEECKNENLTDSTQK